METLAQMRLEAGRHIDEDEIEQYSLGKVREDRLASVEEHLLICETCRSHVHEADRYAHLMRKAAQEQRQHPVLRRRVFGLTLSPVLACVAVMGVALAGWEISRPSADSPYRVALAATRGGGVLPKVPVGRSLELQLDVATLASQPVYRLELVDASGRTA